MKANIIKLVASIIGLIAFSLIIWLVGPLIAIAGHYLLESAGIRLTLILFVWLVWGIHRLLAYRKNQHNADGLLSGLKQAGNRSEGEMARKFCQALDHLKSTVAGSTRAYLYERPWYVIIGPPGGGKTTLLRNSGLKFPSLEQSILEIFESGGGTLNCNWFFMEDAILIDTAGRFITQQNKTDDQAEWTDFLRLLKKYRDRQPINGILVAVSIDDLTHHYADKVLPIRQRLREITDFLDIPTLPIYLVITKCDHLAGFNAFFGRYLTDQRQQVWGETLPLTVSGTPAQAINQLKEAVTGLLHRINMLTISNLVTVTDQKRRTLIYDFPQQLALLQPDIEKVLTDVFLTSRYEKSLFIRGIYLTSATQDGTFFDRVLAGIGTDKNPKGEASIGEGKSYFIEKLLKDVIFAESGLAGFSPSALRRQTILRWAGVGVSTLVLLFSLAVWSMSYQRNRQAIEQMEQEIRNFRAIPLNSANVKAYLRTLVLRLDQLEKIQSIYDQAGFMAHWGLFQGDKLQKATANGYQAWLVNGLLPVIRSQLASRMTGAESRDLGTLFELLRVYLMLGDPAHRDATVARLWISSGWKRDFELEPDVLARLNQHLDRLLALNPDPVPLDEDLIGRIRTVLTRQTVSLQLYARLKSEAQGTGVPDLALGLVPGKLSVQDFSTTTGQDGKMLVIPGLYTLRGYSDIVLARAGKLAGEFANDNWVVGARAGISAQDEEKLLRDLLKLYLADYEQIWREQLAKLRVRDTGTLAETVKRLDSLAVQRDNPLRALLQVILLNTRLSQSDPTAPQSKDRQPVSMSPGASVTDIILEFESHFQEFHQLLEGNPAPIDTLLSRLTALRDHFLLISNLTATTPAVVGNNTVIEQQTLLELSHLPSPFRDWLTALVQAGSGQRQGKEDKVRDQQAQEAKKKLNDALKVAGLAGGQCKTALPGRYPFNRASSLDVTLLDLAKYMAPGGSMDQFFQSNLKDRIDRSGTVWRDTETPPLSPAGITSFQKADNIRTAFFQNGGQVPFVSFQVKPVSLSPDAVAFKLVLEGQEYTYRPGTATQPMLLRWPGPDIGSGARFTFETATGQQVSRTEQGSWATFRLLDTLSKTDSPDRFEVVFESGGHVARFELRAASAVSPFNLPELRSFTCPESL